jgi:hypothetical protein
MLVHDAISSLPLAESVRRPKKSPLLQSLQLSQKALAQAVLCQTATPAKHGILF